jgi:hypothetical protein
MQAKAAQRMQQALSAHALELDETLLQGSVLTWHSLEPMGTLWSKGSQSLHVMKHKTLDTLLLVRVFSIAHTTRLGYGHLVRRQRRLSKSLHASPSVPAPLAVVKSELVVAEVLRGNALCVLDDVLTSGPLDLESTQFVIASTIVCPLLLALQQAPSWLPAPHERKRMNMLIVSCDYVLYFLPSCQPRRCTRDGGIRGLIVTPVAAQVALEALHSQRVAYRALSPTTMVLTTSGHVLLCDLSHGKFLTDRTFTVCGPPEFWAPEVVKQAGHTEAVDWWSLGALLFCLLTQRSPFYSTGVSHGHDIEQCLWWYCCVVLMLLPPTWHHYDGANLPTVQVTSAHACRQ